MPGLRLYGLEPHAGTVQAGSVCTPKQMRRDHELPLDDAFPLRPEPESMDAVPERRVCHGALVIPRVSGHGLEQGVLIPGLPPECLLEVAPPQPGRTAPARQACSLFR